MAGVTFICENMYWSLGSRSIQAMKEIGIKGALVEDIRFDFADSDSLVPDQALREFAAGCRENGLVPVIGLMAEEDYETERIRRALEKLGRAKLFSSQRHRIRAATAAKRAREFLRRARGFPDIIMVLYLPGRI